MIRSPLRSPLNPVLSAVGNRSRSAAYNPATLFAASEQGVWYDPSDLSTMFQDSAGSTPVTAVGQPVGLLLDKSKGLVLGPETLSTPSFAAGLGDWFQSSGAVGAVTWDAAGFVLLRDIGGADGRMRIHTTWVVGATYEVIVKFKRSDGLVLLYAGDRGSGSTDLTIFIASGPIATPVTVKAIFKSSFVSGSLSIMQAGYDISSEIISVSVRELPGNHAKQATPTGRPVLQQDGNGKYYLAFDGVDDSMATAAINFTATDKMTVVTGVRQDATAISMLLELSTDATTNAGSVYITSSETAPGDFTIRNRGSLTVAGGSFGARTLPATRVVAVAFDIAGTTAITEASPRLNGAAQAFSATAGIDSGTGNYGNYPLYIGSRAGTALFFNGRLYSLIVRGALSDAAQIAAAEAYVAGKTGVTL